MKSRKRTSEFFDSYAHDFSAIYGTSNNPLNRIVNRLFRKSMMIRYRKTIEGCYPIQGKRVIDVGCGPGHYCVALARRGARRVLGLDFAPGMIDLARSNARSTGVEDVCDFACEDFMSFQVPVSFDYAVLMGFMDYIRDPGPVIEKVLAVTSSKAFFSFPAAKGFLAWQRKLRYSRRCDLYLYTEDDLKGLFANRVSGGFNIERIERDFFVTVDICGLQQRPASEGEDRGRP
jgi:2-polyprenyl-3-methyl-5-hydroxy-6-metoxy-1,4-benzoquinol methylase